MPDPQVDYDALAESHGAIAPAVDYEALAKQSGATSSQGPAPAPDVLQKALDYRSGNSWVDMPLGLLQGAAKGAIQTIHNGGALLDKIPLVKSADDAYARITGAIVPTEQQWQQGTTANGIGQGTGKFLEQAGEFVLPATEAASALKGAGLTARVLGQAGVGAGVSAVQSGGDPSATAIGGALGGAGELASAAISGGKALLAAKSPTLANFSDSFGGATPIQKARISKALPTLAKDGIVPPNSVYETQDLVKGKLADLDQAYQDLDPAIKARPLGPGVVVANLRDAQDPYVRNGVVTDKASHAVIENQIKTVEDIAAANGGDLTLDDIVHMKQQANGRTNFQSPKVEQSLWKNIGDAYRSSADSLAPETTQLNQDYQRYKDLEQMIDQNIDRGKGTTPSGLDLLKQQIFGHGAGVAAGASLGGAIGNAVGAPAIGAAVGGIAGGIIGPKLGQAAAQALRNAVDSGAFQAMPAFRQGMLKTASAIGDNAAVLRILGQSVAEETAGTSR